jgi:hypothetical protein
MLENESLSPGGMFAQAKPSGMRSSAFNDSDKNAEKISVNELSKKVGISYKSLFYKIILNNYFFFKS